MIKVTSNKLINLSNKNHKMQLKDNKILMALLVLI